MYERNGSPLQEFTATLAGKENVNVESRTQLASVLTDLTTQKDSVKQKGRIYI